MNRFSERPAAFAGSWYPDDPRILIAELKHLFDETGNESELPPGMPVGSYVPEVDVAARAIVAPHAGMVYSGRAAAAAYRSLRGCDWKRIIIIAPSHRIGIHGAATCSFDAYRTPLGSISVDRDAVERLEEKSVFFRQHNLVHEVEHSLEMHLPFLQYALGKEEELSRGRSRLDTKLIPLVVGDADAPELEEAAGAIRELVDDETAVAVSSDFTHYGFDYGFVPFRGDERERLAELDGGAIRTILEVSPEAFGKYMSEKKPTICGRIPITILLHILKGNAAGVLLDYYTSADLTGDRTTSVSYAAIALYDLPAIR